MAHITRMKMTQIQTRIKNGEDMADVAHMYGISIERCEALSGTSRKENKKQIKADKKAADDAVDPADDFSEE